MLLKRKSTGEVLSAKIASFEEKDWRWIKKSRSFSFNWETERDYEVYKIFLLENEDTILGVMSLIDRADEYRIHLNLLELSKAQQGKKKQIEGVAGSLIAFAVENAFRRGYFGFVSLEPKTVLIDHYIKKYGFRRYGRYLGIDGQAGQILIEKYLSDG